MDEIDVKEGIDLSAYLSKADYDQWIAVKSSGSRPLGRYKHSAAVVEDKLYVVGGSRNGRYLSDNQVFDFKTLTWSPLYPSVSPNNSSVEKDEPKKLLLAIAGHSLVRWLDKLLVVSGHTKEASDTVKVWSIDPKTNEISVVNTTGTVPRARGGQSVVLFGASLLMFGGEDTRRQSLNDLHILDLNTMTWDLIKTINMPPSPRFDHSAIIHADRYLLIFGGSSHSTCFNDLHFLDLLSMEWSQPETQGEVVSPRGGHAGAAVDDNWYIVGGGDNTSGATETMILNMSKLVWSIPTKVKGRDPLASEGLTVCSATINSEKFLVAFGGYNGKYNNELYVLKPKTNTSAKPKLFQSPAAAAAAASVSAAYALTSSGENAAHKEVVAADTEKLRLEKKLLESDLEGVRNENSRIKDSLDEMNNSHALLSLELQSVEGQLAAERSRCSKLEMQITEIRTRLETLSSIEKELEELRQEKSKIEREMSLSNRRQSSGSIWGWMGGSAPNNDEEQ